MTYPTIMGMPVSNDDITQDLTPNVCKARSKYIGCRCSLPKNHSGRHRDGIYGDVWPDIECCVTGCEYPRDHGGDCYVGGKFLNVRAKCECGVDSIGAGMHSDWCPKAGR